MWVDTSCFVEYFMEGKPGMANGLTASLGALKDLRITNRFYVYDTTYGTAIVLKYKNNIYLGDQMEYSLINTIKSKHN